MKEELRNKYLDLRMCAYSADATFVALHFFTSTFRNKSSAVYTSPASISLAICRWCDICIFNVRNKDVVLVVVVVVVYL